MISHYVYFRHLWLFKEYTWRPSKETQGKSTEGRTLETFITYTKKSMKGNDSSSTKHLSWYIIQGDCQSTLHPLVQEEK